MEKSLHNEEENTKNFKENMVNRMEKDNGFMKGIINILGTEPKERGGMGYMTGRIMRRCEQ